MIPEKSYKTLVTARHFHGPATNGYDGCHARVAHAGRCPGVEIAEWLNGLPPDCEPYLRVGTGAQSRIMTYGEARDNYIRTNGHVMPQREALAQAMATRRKILHELVVLEKRIAEMRVVQLEPRPEEVTS